MITPLNDVVFILIRQNFYIKLQLIIKNYLIINIYNQYLRIIVAQNELSDKILLTVTSNIIILFSVSEIFKKI